MTEEESHGTSSHTESRAALDGAGAAALGCGRAGLDGTGAGLARVPILAAIVDTILFRALFAPDTAFSRVKTCAAESEGAAEDGCTGAIAALGGA